MDFKYSNFPNEMDYSDDVTAYLSDLTSDDWEKIKKYNQAMIDGRNSDADDLLKSLNGKHITAEDINKIIDCIRAIEKTYFNNTAKYDVITNGNFNNMRIPGIYTMKNPTANKPPTGYYFGLIVLNSADKNHVEQIAFQENTHNIYIRSLYSSHWSEWAKINDGGNADTVDGKHASDFYPITGGELNGNIHITEYGDGDKIDDVKITNTSIEFNSVGEYGTEGDYYSSSMSSRAINIEDVQDDSSHKNMCITSSSIVASGNLNKTISGFDSISSTSFTGDGSNITNVNAAGLNGYTSDDFAEKEHTHNDYLPLSGGTISAEGEDIKITGWGISGNNNATIDNFNTISAQKFSGDGSGLTNIDANTINGKYASDFAEKNHLHDYLPLSGGNLTGDLDIKGELDLHGTLYAEDINTEHGVCAQSFSGDGSELTSVNADTVDGKHASDFAEKSHTHSTISGTLAVSKGGTGATTEIAALKNLGILNSAFNMTNNKPVGGMAFYESIADLGFTGAKTMSEVFDAMPRNTSLCFRNVKNNSAYVSDVPVAYAQIFCIKGAVTENYRYALAFGNNTNDHEIYYYSAESDGVKVNWRKINDGGNTSALNRKIKTFTVNLGSWYRLAHSKNSAANGVFTLSVNSSGNSTSFVFAASQQHTINTGNQYKLNILSKSSFNISVTKLRIVTKYGADDQYIDFYVESGKADAEGEIDVQFFGRGWEVYDTIETCNVADGYTATETEL